MRRLLHLLDPKDSQPSSLYSVSRDVLLHAPITARAAEYCTDSRFPIIPFSEALAFVIRGKLHHRSQGGALHTIFASVCFEGDI